jgi:hypothetical protein
LIFCSEPLILGRSGLTSKGALQILLTAIDSHGLLPHRHLSSSLSSLGFPAWFFVLPFADGRAHEILSKPLAAIAQRFLLGVLRPVEFFFLRPILLLACKRLTDIPISCLVSPERWRFPFFVSSAMPCSSHWDLGLSPDLAT